MRICLSPSYCSLFIYKLYVCLLLLFLSTLYYLNRLIVIHYPSLYLSPHLIASAVEKLYSSMLTLDTKISEAKRSKDAFIARARTAKTTVQVNEMLSSMLG